MLICFTWGGEMYTIGNTLNHKVKQINIKVISKYNEAYLYQTHDILRLTKNYKIPFFYIKNSILTGFR